MSANANANAFVNANVNWDEILEAAETDTGMRRSNNQDSHILIRAPSADAWKRHGHMFIVADGMGAHAVGELASKMACENIPHVYKKNYQKLGQRDAIIKAFKDAGGQIHTKSQANKDFEGMGTTCSTLILVPDGAMVAHVGDSRIYRVRGESIDQLTFDHSLVWELIHRNRLPPEEAAKIRMPKNVITRSLGPDPGVEVDIEGPFAVQPGDVFVLCSDGLSGFISDPEIGSIANSFPPNDAARYLLHLANLRGGLDNITVVVLRLGAWTEPGEPGESGPQPAAAPAKAEGKRGGFLGGLLQTLKRPKATLAASEHDDDAVKSPYMTAPCPVNIELVAELYSQISKARDTAIMEGWSVNWPKFSEHLAQIHEARQSNRVRQALKHCGESIVILGIAGRVFRKHSNARG